MMNKSIEYEKMCDKDNRVIWMKKKLMKLMDIEDEKIWEKMMCRNGKRMAKQMFRYVNSMPKHDGLNMAYVVLIVFKTFYIRHVIKDVFITKKIVRINPQERRESLQSYIPSKSQTTQKFAMKYSLSDRDNEEEDDTRNINVKSKRLTKKSSKKTEDNEECGKRKTKMSNSAKENKCGQSKTVSGKKLKKTSSHSTDQHNESPKTAIHIGEDQSLDKRIDYARIKQVIKVERKQCQLHGYFGIPGNIRNDTKYVYIIKKLNRAFPKFASYEEAEAEMPNYVHVGTYNGQNTRCMMHSLQVN
ncbi:hypothetical protein O3M35_004025 [Rhynocoris fuscipes]|uniref:Uncharacterized protein n=1 Tax=Rhynocoris fuscipes TaxID=488301 RepID=A0AAW1CNR0_9HEMI